MLLLPPADEVCEGYVFTGVCLSTGEEDCLPPPDRHPSPPGQIPLTPGQTSPTPGQTPPWADTPRQTPPSACWDTHPSLPSACWDTVNKRAVRIPLECILVDSIVRMTIHLDLINFLCSSKEFLYF